MWIFIGIIGLLVIVIIAIQIPFVQNNIANRATRFLSEKLETRVEVESINIGFPKTINIRGVYIEDKQGDTLLFAKELDVGLDMFKLLKSEVLVRSINLNGLSANIYRLYPDTTFNYSFIPEAFASKEPAPVEDEQGEPMKVDVNKIDLSDIRLVYRDTISGILARVYIGELATSFERFDIENTGFAVDDISLKNTTLAYIETIPLIPPDTTTSDSSSSMDLNFNRIILDNIHANYISRPAGNDLKAFLGRFEIESDSLDLVKRQFDIKRVLLSNSTIDFKQTKPQLIDTLVTDVIREEEVEKKTATPEWVLTLDNLELNNNKLSYRNLDSIQKTRGIDFNDLAVYDFTFASSKIFASPGIINLNLDKFSFKEKSGFVLEEFSSKISYDTTHVTLDNLVIRTLNSKIADHITARFSSLDALSDSIDKVRAEISLNDTRIAVADILYLMPELQDNPNLKIRGNEVFTIDGRISGTLEELTIDNLTFADNKSTRLALSGTLRDVMKPESLYADVSSASFRTRRDDILAYVSKDMIPETISIPEAISFDGSFTGYIKNFNSSIDISTSYGSINADIKMNPSRGNREVPYMANVNVKDLDLGKLLMQPDTLGPLTLTASIDGYGMNPDSLHANLKATIVEANYNQYTYNDLNIEGKIVNRSFDGNISMDDENLNFEYSGYVNAHPDSMTLDFTLNLENVDLYALKLTTDSLAIKGLIKADLVQQEGPNPTGKIRLSDFNLKQDQLICPIDSVIITSAYSDNTSKISINSHVLNAEIEGNIKLSELGTALTAHIDKYFDIASDSTIMSDTTTNFAQDFDFAMTVEDPNNLCEDLMPSLKKYAPITVKGNYNSQDMALDARVDIPLVDYNGTVIDSLFVEVKSNEQNLDYDLKVVRISNATVALDDFDLNGSIGDNKITYNINAQKGDDFNVLRTSGLFSGTDSSYVLVIKEPLILNNTAWTIDPDNMITFSDKGLDAQKVILSGEEQMVSILTQPGEYVPLQITFKDFKLSNISQIIENEKELVRGKLDGYFTLFNIEGVSAFTSDLAIDSLSVMSMPVGNITLLADNSKNPRQFDVNFNLSGHGNDLTAQGFYQADTTSGIINIDVSIPRINMSSIEPFTFGQVNRTSGYLSGDIAIEGAVNDPEIAGDLSFNDVAFNANYIDSYLKIGSNTIRLSENRLVFNEFTLTDTLNNQAVLNGNIDIADLTNPQFDLRIVTEDFLAMNSTRQKDVPVYGKVLIDSDIRATGTPSSPNINLKAQLNNGTSVTFVLPQDEAGTEEREGVVEFVDSLSTAFVLPTDTVAQTITSVEGISLDAQLTFQPEAVLKILIDPLTGDSLFVKGEGTLNFTMDPGGQTNLTGRYEIRDGGYNITLSEFLKRQFKISEGSSITWNGDIMDATVDITAIYEVETSPMMLINDQIENGQESEQNEFRNEMTFFVYLKMSGELMKPQISFDIEQPEDERGAHNGAVYNKLNELRTDETQLNKQVFALLALNRFLGQDPFETGNAPMTFESATRASASKLLTQQFNALSDKYIKGVDLDVGVESYEDYSSGSAQGRTELQLGVSKEFLDDRVSVQVGGNIDLEGEQAQSNKASDIAGNISVEYKLTPQGRYRLKGFRRTDFDPILGELINTGVGFIYSRDFRKIKQLFKKRRDRGDTTNEK